MLETSILADNQTVECRIGSIGWRREAMTSRARGFSRGSSLMRKHYREFTRPAP
jgi:hypothetical protein